MVVIALTVMEPVNSCGDTGHRGTRNGNSSTDMNITSNVETNQTNPENDKNHSMVAFTYTYKHTCTYTGICTYTYIYIYMYAYT